MKKNQLKRIGEALLVMAVIYALETISYFFIAEYFGNLFGRENTLNLQLPVDKLLPWFTPLFMVYIPWVFVWFAAIPLIIYGAGGRRAYYRYCVNGFFMYIIGTLIYMIFPSTTTPLDFVNGTLQTLPPDAWFHDTIYQLAHSPHNIWGSFPSYHNYWASLFIFFGLAKGTRWYFRYPMILLGAAISLSTLLLHQHCVMDVLITYPMTALFLYLTDTYRLAEGLEAFLDRLFKVEGELLV